MGWPVGWDEGCCVGVRVGEDEMLLSKNRYILISADPTYNVPLRPIATDEEILPPVLYFQCVRPFVPFIEYKYESDEPM